MRTYIYIDGFNFYYGAVKDTAYKWLDFNSLFTRQLGPAHQILSIKYFTALVSGKLDPHQPLRQKTFLRALQKHIPIIEIYYGHFLSHEIYAPLANPSKTRKFEKIIKTEEKGSDVNLAVQLLNDAWMNRYDCAVVVSNDSDIAEALKLVKNQHNKKIGLVFPDIKKSRKRYPSKELMKYSDFIKPTILYPAPISVSPLFGKIV